MNKWTIFILLGVGIALLASAGKGDDVADPNMTPDNLDKLTLARVLASEAGSNRGAMIVIGWIVIQSARRHGWSVTRRVLGYQPTADRPAKYGRRTDAGGYVSTRQIPTVESSAIAEDLLSGTLMPSPSVRDALANGARSASFVEEGGEPGANDTALIRQQGSFGGIVGRIQGTDWYLYRDGAPRIASLAETPTLEAEA